MQLTIALWSDPNEKPANFIEATTRHSGLSFSTAADGGFTDCNFTIQTGGWNAVRWYRAYLGFHVVIFDHFGRRLWEGRIEDAEAKPDGVSVNCLGYSSFSTEQTYTQYFDGVDPTLTPTVLIKSVVDMASKPDNMGVWSDDTSMIATVTHDLKEQTFGIDQKLKDAIDMACKFGDDDILNPKPVYFGIWENRRAYFQPAPDITTKEADWRVYQKDAGDGLSLSRSRSNVWNKLQVTFDDPLIGSAFTDWAENLESQRLFGKREGTLNIGSAPKELAEVIRDLAIKSYAFPEQDSSITVAGRVYTQAGAPDFPYMIRAGQTVRVMDYDASVAQMVTGSSGSDTTIAYIARTSYSADSNEMQLELGRRNVALDLLMARLGQGGSGSVS